MKFTFVHAADLHLDSPFRGLTAAAGEASPLADRLLSATFDAFDALVELCLARRAAFLVVAGDVYDSSDRSLRAQLRFRDGLERLGRHGVQCFVAHGNHDALDSRSPAVTPPPGTHVFGGDAVETFTVERDGQTLATVSGISYRTRHEKRPLQKLFAKSATPGYHVAVLHCNAGGNPDHEPYVPCEVRELAAAGYDYWAMGHVHEWKILERSPLIAYSGNTQGRSVRETGERGCLVVEVDTERRERTEVEFCPLATVRWEMSECEATGLESFDALDARLQEHLAELREKSGGKPLLCRLALTGRTALAHDLRQPTVRNDLLARLRAAFPWRSAQPVWVESLGSQCRLPADRVGIAERGDFLGEIARIGEAWRQMPEAAAQVRPLIADIEEHARSRQALPPLDDAELARLVEAALDECLDRFEEAEP